MPEPLPALARPRWLSDLVRFLPLKGQFVLSGKVYDLQLPAQAPGLLQAMGLGEAVASACQAANGARTLTYNPVDGFSDLIGGADGAAAGALLKSVVPNPAQGQPRAGWTC